MKCPICDQRKAKRSCPAKNAQLCAQCCGEKRILEINCPETCEYLQTGRKREGEEHAKILHLLSPQDLQKYRHVLMSHQDILARIEYAIGRERILSHDLMDKDVAEAVAILLKTYKTEDNGILYETVSENLRVEPVRRELRSVIEKMRNPEGNKNQGIIAAEKLHLPLDAIIECLEFIQAVMTAYQEKRSSGRDYVDLLARMIPREEKKPSSILFP
jgi:hypothetical protein